MHKHSRSTVLGLAVLGLALIAAPAFAANLFTVNTSEQEGAAGSKLFVPAFVVSNDTNGVLGAFAGSGIYIPYIGTTTPCTSMAGQSGNCNSWGASSLEAWANGIYYDPRFGTPFIPPSGDHHRTGYRLLMQPSFSGGMWNTGFASLAQVFPFFPEVGTMGAGGDVGAALANQSLEAGLTGILAFLDGHGEPLTTGKFPRYWPHERQAWVDTLMVKYTAGGALAGDGLEFTQSLRSSVGFSRQANTPGNTLRWRAMSNLDGHFSAQGGNSDGCDADGTGPLPGAWCEFYTTVDATTGNVALYVVKSADGNTETADSGAVEITQSTRTDTLSSGTFNGGIGKVLTTKTLNNLEKLPTLIDDRLAQVDNDLDGLGVTNESFGANGGLGPAVGAEPGQVLLSQFQVVSGPNVHSEEGADPYSWVICGVRGMEYGEDDCVGDSNAGKGAIDAAGHVFAIVYVPNNTTELGEGVLTRFGRDINPRRVGNTLYPSGATDSLSPDSEQDVNAFVECTTGTPTSPWSASDCESDPGGDLMFGTADDGTIYYKEAIENGLRGWIRETNGHAFGFLGADFNAGNGTDPNFGLTQLMEQNIEGFLMSCLGCNPHSLPSNIEEVTYQFDWPGNFNINNFPHAPDGRTTITILTP
jgi:hypothetical protein